MKSIFVALAALSGLATANPLGERDISPIGKYSYAGCYVDSVNSRTLNQKVMWDDSMTLEMCENACQGYKYWGTEYGRECYCGNTILNNAQLMPDASCGFTCPGNINENCGSGDRLSLFAYSGAALPQPKVATVNKYEGCHTEAPGRALIDDKMIDYSMTVEKCSAYCSQGNYNFFGIEYFHECYCGNIIQPGSVLANETYCSDPCAGDTTESCGGGGYLSMYSYAPAYDMMGCYTETPSRALKDNHLVSDSMTVEMCSAFCGGYNLFGLEWYRECYCGATLDTASTKADILDCKYPCKANTNETCGGDGRISLYQNLAIKPPVLHGNTVTQIGCYTDDVSNRALEAKAYYDDSMTVEKCQAACSAYNYYGLEYGRECYCDNVIRGGSTKALDSDCSFVCPGAHNETCGAGNRLSMYMFSAATAP